ncbi:MAG TPA: carboxypeptidase-like regulatory domain-containing protein [Thermoplasmata archaeon]|nr:carboxypeptidase-like regulatory domain-containing protein [Thermoplasmata archaeon]
MTFVIAGIVPLVPGTSSPPPSRTGAAGPPLLASTIPMPSSSVPPPPVAYPGQSSAGEPSIDPALALRTLEHSGFLIAPAQHNATDALAAARSSVAPLPMAATPPRLSRAASSTVGYVDGVIVSVRPPYAPVSGANVSIEPVAGFCPTDGCITAVTGSNGTFYITAATGENTVVVSASYYVTNRTWVNVTDGGTTDIGSIGLVQDGYITGLLLTDDPAHEPVAGVNMTAVTRDGIFQAFPTGSTAANGSFTIAVPPEPSQINFNPPILSSYLPNVTFVNASAGRTLDIGTVYLEHLTPIGVDLVNSVTGQPVANVEVTVQVCSKVSGSCASRSTNYNYTGPTMTALAPVGPDSVAVGANGYVTNDTSLGIVPPSPLTGPPFPMGTIEMVPDGVIAIDVNITGVPAPYGITPPTSLWPVGWAIVQVCSLDGYSTWLSAALIPLSNECVGACVPPGLPLEMPAPPLRDFIAVAPDISSQCGAGHPLWPTPPDLPVGPNWGYANLSAGHLLNAGSIDLLPGTYVEGQVLPRNETGWSVNICSTDETSECDPAVTSDAGYLGDPYQVPPSDCPGETASGANYTFCAPAPPGPVRITVTSPTASTNFTWANIPYLEWTDNPLPLTVASNPSVASIWLVSAELTGLIEETGTFDPVAYAAVSVCPAGLSSGSNRCGQGGSNGSGYFNTSAPIGWDQVTFSGPGFVGNSSWVYVNRTNNTGTLLLTPEADVQGQVVTPDGVGLYSATVQSCPAPQPYSCSLLGEGGQTSTDGRYFGALDAGSLPLGTYEIVATAPGYRTDWTWVNVSTPGNVFTAPTIVLAPLLAPGGFEPRVAVAPTPSAAVGAWVIGRVIDAQGGVGLPQAFVNATPVDGGPSVTFTAAQGTGGEFNDSVPTGAYDIGISETGFFPASVFVNITGEVDPVDIGTIALQPYPVITGRSVIDPGAWREGVTYADGLGAPAVVTVCSRGWTTCNSGLTDSSGDFNVSAPPGTYDEVNLTPSALVGPDTYAGGFLANQTYVDVSNATGLIGASPVIGLDIFGVITGSVVAANTSGASPVRYDAIEFSGATAIDLGGAVSNVSGGTELNTSGAFVMAYPPTPKLLVVAGGLGAWIPGAAQFTGTERGPGGSPTYALGVAGSLAVGSAFALTHYGWVVMQVTNSATSAPVPYATLSANEGGTLEGTAVEYTSQGVANALGYLNMTAPPSLPSSSTVALNLSGADYLYQHFSVFVNSSETTDVNTSVRHGGVDLRPWGWVQGIVVDTVTGEALSGVNIQSNGAGFQQGRSGITTNGAGLFLTDAPVGENDSVSHQEPGYSFNLTTYPVSSGEVLGAATVALTGDGTVEGEVVALPGGTPVYDATVSACPDPQLTCANQVSTNASGIFVVDAAVGLDTITVSAPGFTVPSPAYFQVGSDQWYWLGAIGVYSYANVAGEVLAIPGGLPIVGATVTLCPSAIAGYGGLCFDTVETGENGSFFVSGPAGSYVLEASAPFYNTTALPLALTNGETLRVGIVFVFEFGVGTGLVEAGPTGSPIGGASVTACEAWGTDLCLGATTTGSNGRYAVAGPSGPYTVSASAPGYQTSYEAVSLVSGATVTVPPLLLIPIGPGNQYVVSGFVEAAGPTPTPLSGAVVAAGGGVATGTSATGAFSLTLDWGTYTLTAALPGYVTGRLTLNVTAPVTDLTFRLTVMTFLVTGTVRDGLSGLPLVDVQMTEGGVPDGAPSAENGSYSLDLPNGTHPLVATDLAASVEYAPVPFVLTVSGTPLVWDLSLDPPVVHVDGLVANALTGQAVAGAAVTLTGTTADGPKWSATATSGADGRFVVTVYPGVYEVEASDAGYASTNVSLTLGVAANAPVSLVLTPLGSGGTTTGATTWWLVGGVAGAAVLGAIVVLMVRREVRRK